MMRDRAVVTSRSASLRTLLVAEVVAATADVASGWETAVLRGSFSLLRLLSLTLELSIPSTPSLLGSCRVHSLDRHWFHRLANDAFEWLFA
jgi:hypothetical protein